MTALLSCACTRTSLGSVTSAHSSVTPIGWWDDDRIYAMGILGFAPITQSSGR